MSETKTTTVAKINQVDIVVIENGEKRVAIKPICQALGIDEDAQRRKLNDDPILNSVTVLSTATGSDGKSYQMVTIPFKYVFGWLFRIDSRNVKEDAREAVLKYQIECYDILYNYFAGYKEYIEHKQQLIDKQLDIIEEAKTNFNTAKKTLDEANSELKLHRAYSYTDYRAEKAQLKMFSDEQMGKSV